MLRYLITAFMALALLTPVGAQAATITFQAGPNGTLSGTPVQNPTVASDVTPVTATGNLHYHFQSWTGSGGFTSTQNPLQAPFTPSLDVSVAQTITANFVIDTYQVNTHGISNAAVVKGGASHTVVLKTDNTVVAWGGGDGQSNVDGLSNILAIGVGTYHSLAVEKDGETVHATGVWIDPANGNNSTAVTVPAELGGATGIAHAHGGIIALAGGYSHSIALMKDGTVYAWGPPAYNTLGQLDTPANLPTLTAIAAGHFHNVGLTSTGTVVQWGNPGYDVGLDSNNIPRITMPTDLTGVAAIDAKAYHTVALKSDGTVVCWGDNEAGQSTVPSGLGVVKGIAAGGHHTVALKQDGTVASWGDNTFNQSTPPVGLTGITSVSGGTYFTLAMKGNLAVVGWGNNGSTQLNVPNSVYSTISNGSATCTSPVDYNTDSACTFSPAAGYSLLTFLVNGIDKKSLVSANSATLANVTDFTSATVVFAKAPDAPIINDVTATATTATVAFSTPTSDGGSAIIDYTATATSTGHPTVTATGTASPLTLAGLVPGASYTVTVAARNGIGSTSSTGSNLNVVKTDQTITFGQPSDVSSTIGTVTLTATASSNLAVLFVSETLPVCTVSGNTVTIIKAGTCTIDATQPGDTTFAAATTVTHSFAVIPAVVEKYKIIAPPNATAGTSFSITVNAVDSGDLLVSTFAGPVTLTTTAGTITPTSVDLTNGTATVSVTLTGAGTGKTITATDAATKTGSATLDVLPAPAETFKVEVPSSASAGGSFNFTVTAYDHYNNVATGYVGTIHFTSSDTATAAALPVDYSFVAGDNGIKTFAATLDTAGTQTVTATDTTTSSVTGTSNSIGITPSDPKLLVTANATATAGTAFPVTVAVQDNFGNPISDYVGTIHFTSSDTQAVLPADYTFTLADGGSHVFDGVILKTAPSQTVTATDTVTAATTGVSGSIVVAPTAPMALAFGQQPTSTVAGQAITPAVTVKVVDQFGNVVTTSNASITVAVGTNPDGATLSGTATQTAQAGVATFPDLSLNRTGSGYTLSAVSDTLPAATSNAFDISTGTLDHFVIASVTNQILGVPFPITVTAVDASGNTVTSFTGTVELTATGGTVTPTTSGAFVNGVWTGDVTVPAAATGLTLNAKTTGGTEAGTSSAFDVVKGSQTITITSQIPVVAPFQGTFDVSATASSSLPVTITGSGACTGTGTGTVTISIVSGSGTCTILFEQAGDASYDAATALVQHVTAGKIEQAIIIDTAAPTSATFGSTFTVAAHAPGGTVAYSGSGGCTNSGATFTMTSATVACTVNYSQEGSDIYFPATFSTTTGAVAALPGAPTIFSVKAANGQATIIFMAPSQTGGSPITGYTVTANPGNIPVTGTNSPITVTGLTNGTAYTFSVTAQNSAGSSTAAVSDPTTPEVTGDLDGNGVVDIRDAMLAVRVSVGLQTATPAMLAAGDVAPLVGGKPSPDGKIDVGDVIVLLRKVVGQVTF